MQVGIDITSIVYERGVSRYTANLVRALAKRKDVSLSLYGCTMRQKPILERFVKSVLHENPLAQRRVSANFQSLPPKLQELMWYGIGRNRVRAIFPQLDVFHSWDWIQPPDKDLPLVSTIHDLAILKFPETAHPKILDMHQRSWKILKERNAQIIAVSRATRRDVIELLDFPAERVHVVYEALPMETVRVNEAMTEEQYEAIKLSLGLNKPFLLFVGTREPRKNLVRLIEAWQGMEQDIELLIAGEAGWDRSEDAATKKSKKQPRFLGKITNEELAVLYGEAEVFCYPSLYEGFGLPILEAFYHGTPVVTSNVSSLPEVAGNAAELVDPNSVESIRKGIELILKESTENQQKRLQRMIIRLQMFSWDKVAEETLKVYAQAQVPKD
jgi:glycosyltransferase involved in cell wall biosynthesis